MSAAIRSPFRTRAAVGTCRTDRRPSIGVAPAAGSPGSAQTAAYLLGSSACRADAKGSARPDRQPAAKLVLGEERAGAAESHPKMHHYSEFAGGCVMASVRIARDPRLRGFWPRRVAGLGGSADRHDARRR